MKPNIFLCGFFLLLSVCLAACGSSKNKNTSEKETNQENNVQVPEFNADSAYLYIQKQVAFGPRVPNTEAHRKCGGYLSQQLRDFGATVYNQFGDVISYDGKVLKMHNIIGSYNLDTKKRVLLCAHWDSRPYADAGQEAHYHTPIDGANDSASGVGVLLEIARHLQQQAPAIGIDIVFFDAEDYGIPEFYEGDYKQDTWCLGSQYWGRVPHVPDYKARFGILLDMVGGKGATFYYEQYSSQTANSPMKKIWDTAHRLGHKQFFIKENGGNVTDDHIYVNRLRQIPCVDIIGYDPHSETGFHPTWHTVADNMDCIDKATLQAVGETVMNVIYNEK